MNMHNARKRLLASIVLSSVAAMHGSHVLEAQNPAGKQLSLSSAIRAKQWDARRDAFAVLIGVDRAAYVRGGIANVGDVVGRTLRRRKDENAEQQKRLLIELLSVENQVVADKERTRRQRGLDELPPDERFAEEYVNYYADVIAAVVALGDIRSVQALVGAITTGSMATEALVGFGTRALMPVAARITDEDPMVRGSVVHTLSGMLERSSSVAKDAQARALIKKALMNAAKDEHYLVRGRAAAGLVRVGDAESIAIVKELAENDPYVDVVPFGKGGYPVREAAARALKGR